LKKFGKTSYIQFGGSNSCNFNLWAMRESKLTGVEIAPYNMANVDAYSGWVCWGFQKYPLSLRQAHFNFWQATLNNSMHRFDPYSTSKNKDFVEFLKNSKPTGFNDAKYELFGKEYLSTNRPTSGIFISVDEKLITKFSDNLVNNPYGHKVLIGFVNRKGSIGAWQIDLPKKTIYLDDEKVFVQ